jgi:hypothetical protein
MMMATHTTVRSLTKKVEGVGHKFHMDNFFSPCTQEVSTVVGLSDKILQEC